MIDVRAVAGMDPAQLAVLAATMSGGLSSHPSSGLSLSKVPVVAGEPLRLEIDSFLECVRSGALAVVSGEEGRRALALALAITSAIDEHAKLTGLPA